MTNVIDIMCLTTDLKEDNTYCKQTKHVINRQYYYQSIHQSITPIKKSKALTHKSIKISPPVSKNSIGGQG